MATYILPQNTYTPLVGNRQRETIIETSPQEYKQPVTSDRVNDFDDLYDISEGEEELTDIPITISVANSPVATRNGKSYPTLAIPDLSMWPSVHSYKNQPQMLNTGLLSPPLAVPRVELSRMQQGGSARSSSSRTPSLDGSLTSDEMNSISCPSTPEVGTGRNEESSWTLPAQLNPQSLLTLAGLSGPKSPESQMFTLQSAEMSEKGADLAKLHTNFEIAMTPIENGELSALSIPSPGGFFSSLNVNGPNAWVPETPQEQLQTTVAENFYGRPFDSPTQELPPLPTISQQWEDDNQTEGPPTARHVTASWNLGSPSFNALKSPDYFAQLEEYNEDYERKMREQSMANIDRTSSWLASMGAPASTSCTSTPETVSSEFDESADIIQNFPELPKKVVDANQDQTFVRGFEHMQKNQQPSDTFIHRRTRTEKLRLDRKCLFTSHVSQLEGKYALNSPPHPSTAKRVSDLDTVVEDEAAEKLAIATAVREQKALEQIQPVSWSVEATKFLNGGTLLTSPVMKTFASADARILDLGGLSSCDWAWQVAIDHPSSSVYTVCLPDTPIDNNMATPENHQTLVVDSLWKLPFRTGYFDCVSARNLHALLKLVRPNKRGGDEYDLVLKECMRVLRPGGYLEFALLDADIMSAGPVGQAMNDEVTYNLRTRGYDAAPTKSWLSRVRKAGFGQIRRAWLVLPMSQYNGSNTTADASHISGMVGAWAWERWLLKLQREMGQEENGVLSGVAAVMEEGARTGAGWRYLSGWARKP